jgi:hypothetical protein
LFPPGVELGLLVRSIGAIIRPAVDREEREAAITATAIVLASAWRIHNPRLRDEAHRLALRLGLSASDFKVQSVMLGILLAGTEVTVPQEHKDGSHGPYMRDTSGLRAKFRPWDEVPWRRFARWFWTRSMGYADAYLAAESEVERGESIREYESIPGPLDSLAASRSAEDAHQELMNLTGSLSPELARTLDTLTFLMRLCDDEQKARELTADVLGITDATFRQRYARICKQARALRRSA